MTEKNKKQEIIKIYTDGACKGNPGPGGYAALLLYKDHVKKISGGFRLTTNNRMEIMACVEGLKLLKRPCNVQVYSDSKYVVDTIKKGWAKRWKQNGWKRNAKEYALNIDLWEQFLTLCEKHKVELIWIKGHAGHKENELVDDLAVKMSQKPNLPADEIYELSRKQKQSSLI